MVESGVDKCQSSKLDSPSESCSWDQPRELGWERRLEERVNGGNSSFDDVLRYVVVVGEVVTVN